MKRVLVIGLGISGRSAVDFLLRRGHEVWATDDSPNKLEPIDGAHICPMPEVFDRFDEIILSPGVPNRFEHPHVIGEVELACRELPCRAVGITGTNGKTTTTLLVAHVLTACGLKGRAVGNIGVPLTSQVDLLQPDQVAVIELSSYQLETLSTPCLDAAAILNITPDHLDRYGSMEAYAAAKWRIKDVLKKEGTLFINNCVVEAFPAIRYTGGNREAAFHLCGHFGVDREAFERAAASFQPPPHRMEWVATLDGVTYVNDSKGTNVAAVVHAVEELSGPIILIAGGRGKEGSYDPWREAFGGKVSHLCLIGEAAGEIEGALADQISCSRHETLQEAVDEANGRSVPGGQVLLSPGCASFDMFRNYEERGERFKQIVREKELR